MSFPRMLSRFSFFGGLANPTPAMRGFVVGLNRANFATAVHHTDIHEKKKDKILRVEISDDPNMQTDRDEGRNYSPLETDPMIGMRANGELDTPPGFEKRFEKKKGSSSNNHNKSHQTRKASQTTTEMSSPTKKPATAKKASAKRTKGVTIDNPTANVDPEESIRIAEERREDPTKIVP
eukprot:TRINITY_DN12873_c0_g1_i1.p1 TRINITY_DN12873_c0_g1~~TRINITY_DN12873_c0_g1_i1.p1  ORF type:complete len:179 (-),score=46.58 TRINITY_DN12873_c0_g1_i1:79-615(-)